MSDVNLQKGLVWHGLTGHDPTKDKTPHDRHPTVNGSPSTVAGQVGKCLDFDGTNDYLDIEEYITLNAPFAIAVWLNVDQIGSEGVDREPGIISQSPEGEFNNWASLSDEGGGNVRLWIDGDNGNISRSDDIPFSTGVGGHFIISIGQTDPTFYFNGTEVEDTFAQGTSSFVARYPATGYDGHPDGGRPDGRMNDLRLYERELTQQDATTLSDMRAEQTRRIDPSHGAQRI